jgi:hypothetical protein
MRKQNGDDSITNSAGKSQDNRPNQKLEYVKPELTCYGDVRDLTLSPTPGSFESGTGVSFKS